MSIQTPSVLNLNSETTPLLPKKKPKIQNQTKVEFEEKEPSYYSYFTFNWMSDLIYKAYGSSLTEKDIKQILEDEKAKNNTEKIEKYLEYYRPNNVVSLILMIILVYWKLILWIFVLNIFSNISVLISPFFVQQLLKWFISEKAMNNSTWMLPGYGWAICLLLTTFFGRTLGIHVNWKNWILYIRVNFYII